MKRLSFMPALAVVMALGMAATAFGADHTTVTLTANDTLEYSGTTGTYTKDGVTSYVLGDEFEGLLPGETATSTITLTNNNKHSASFYVSQNTLATLEEANNASGGAYTFAVSVGESLETSTQIVESVAGGYDGDSNASSAGLSDLTELNDFTFVANLASGESTNLYLTLTLEGEGMDSTDAVDYSNAVAALSMEFRAYYDDSTAGGTTTTRVVTNTVSEVVVVDAEDNSDDTVTTASDSEDDADDSDDSSSKAAKTGDTAMPLVGGAVLLAGVACVVVATKRKKVQSHE